MSCTIATVMPQGTIALPLDVCEKMRLEAGSSVAFVCEDDRVVMVNPAIYAMRWLQKEMEGEAERVGLTTEEDIIALCREIRAEVEGR
jgi:bifunctional DNA-binding transcriptional regulator/antitoxin component of YhaV-PrlF toxin-antitoxin module